MSTPSTPRTRCPDRDTHDLDRRPPKSSVAKRVDLRAEADVSWVDPVSDDIARSGRWPQWCALDNRLAGLASFETAKYLWGTRDPWAYQVVAALVSIGCRRGGDDDLAAMAVVVLLRDGAARLARDLSDMWEPGDVHTALWETVKLAEPHAGPRAARFLLQRTRQRLTRPALGLVRGRGEVSLDELVGRDDDDSWSRADQVAARPRKDAGTELVELLSWARDAGVVTATDCALVLDLIAVSAQTQAAKPTSECGYRAEEAQRILGANYGVAMRTIRRRRDLVVHRLRGALPAYLAETG